ncbi:nucleotidyltransferase [Spirochaetia bacterium]|nr:nucleotidyltransferase [Spirochaetia bacterium]
MDEDIRWKQRLENYKKSLAYLAKIVDCAKTRELTGIEQLGIIKAFELTFELAWNVMKDFLTTKGITGIIGSKDSVRFAFQNGLIADGQLWMAMINDRNQTTHTYEEALAELIGKHIIEQYYDEFSAFAAKMEQLH